jgi:hypothetical protein
MKLKIILTLLIFLLILGCKEKRKGRQIIHANGKEYYVDYYTVLLSSDCIEFTAYEKSGDSSFVRVCSDWDVRPNKK